MHLQLIGYVAYSYWTWEDPITFLVTNPDHTMACCISHCLAMISPLSHHYSPSIPYPLCIIYIYMYIYIYVYIYMYMYIYIYIYIYVYIFVYIFAHRSPCHSHKIPHERAPATEGQRSPLAAGLGRCGGTSCFMRWSWWSPPGDGMTGTWRNLMMVKYMVI